MHELALIQEVMDSVITGADMNGIKSIARIKLLVGKLSGANPQALEFAFNAVKKETMLEHTKLVIEEIPPIWLCRECNIYFDSQGWEYFCPHCNSTNIIIHKGQDVFLEYYEGTEGD